MIDPTPGNQLAGAVRLNKKLGSEQQVGEIGTTIAGQGSNTKFRDADRVAQNHGGDSASWVKKSSSSHTAPDGTKFETHWVENIKTGQRVEHKTMFGK